MDISYEICYSNRKTVSLIVKGAKLIVRAPYFTKKERIEEIVKKHTAWVIKSIKKQEEKKEREHDVNEDQIKALKSQAKTVINNKVEKYSQIMGLKHGRITITSAKTRYGSCSSKGNLSFSYRLMHYPDDIIDYVVVHELAHLVHMNHSKSFYALVERYYPNYKDAIKILKG
jgi:predicted metal-dependent hydrolase